LVCSSFWLLLDVSLASERGFAQVGEWLRYPLVKVLVISSIWALLHHMCAGIRHLFPRRRRRHEPARGQAQRFCGVRRQPRADCLDRGADMVNRIIVAHYGLKDWLAQRVTALLMIGYTVIFLVVWPRPMSYAGGRRCSPRDGCASRPSSSSRAC